MYRPTNKELNAIITVAATTAMVLFAGDFGVVSAVLVGILFALAEFRRISRGSARTSRLAGS